MTTRSTTTAPTRTRKPRLDRRTILLSGAHAKRGRFAPPPPTRSILDIGRNVSLDITLAQYEVAPNALTLAKIGGGL